MKGLAIIATLALCACQGEVIYRDRPVRVSVPVAQPCASARPGQVEALKERVPDAEWRELDVRQKAAWVGRQGLDRLTYAEQLEAATGACPEVGGD